MPDKQLSVPTDDEITDQLTACEKLGYTNHLDYMAMLIRGVRDRTRAAMQNRIDTLEVSVSEAVEQEGKLRDELEQVRAATLREIAEKLVDEAELMHEPGWSKFTDLADELRRAAEKAEKKL